MFADLGNKVKYTTPILELRSDGTIAHYDNEKLTYPNKSDVNIYLLRILSVERSNSVYIKQVNDLKAQLTFLQQERNNAVKSFSALNIENNELRDYFIRKFVEASE